MFIFFFHISSFSSSSRKQDFSSVECFIHKQSKIFQGVFILCSESNANKNSHGFLKYVGSISSYLKSSNVGLQRTKWTLLSTADRHNGHFKSSTLQTLSLDLCTLISDNSTLNLVSAYLKYLFQFNIM